jgi:hypothetical protein
MKCQALSVHVKAIDSLKIALSSHHLFAQQEVHAFHPLLCKYPQRCNHEDHEADMDKGVGKQVLVIQGCLGWDLRDPAYQ